ncbi:MAG: type I phosphomannose isomerase catalytic subunit [Thermoguttaceae bacterium]
MIPLYPLRFRLLVRRYLWGNRRLETCLGKPLGPGNDYAESWEVSDHGADQSIVDQGPLAGAMLGDLVRQRGAELLGRHHPQTRFPLLVKFLDAAQALSVQVHPNDDQAARLNPPDLGKTEAWYILSADPESRIYAGLRSGADRKQLADAIRQGTCEKLLYHFEAKTGDCLFIPAGTVHALGAGLVVAEVQQSSDTTFRLYDWNRVGPDGKPRRLHVEQGLAVVDYQRGPVDPVKPQPTDRPGVSRLVACEKFIMDRWDFDQPQVIGGDDRFHIVCVLQGAVSIEGDPQSAPLLTGGTALLPAGLGSVRFVPQQRTVLLEAHLG